MTRTGDVDADGEDRWSTQSQPGRASTMGVG